MWWTHLYKIETGQQADTVFGQNPLFSRRHGRASKYPQQIRDETREEWLCSSRRPAGIRSSPCRCACSRMLGITSRSGSGDTPDPQTCTVPLSVLVRSPGLGSVHVFQRAVRYRTEPHRPKEEGERGGGGGRSAGAVWRGLVDSIWFWGADTDNGWADSLYEHKVSVSRHMIKNVRTFCQRSGTCWRVSRCRDVFLTLHVPHVPDLWQDQAAWFIHFICGIPCWK